MIFKWRPVGHIQPAEPSNPAATGFQNPFIKATDKKNNNLNYKFPPFLNLFDPFLGQFCVSKEPIHVIY